MLTRARTQVHVLVLCVLFKYKVHVLVLVTKCRNHEAFTESVRKYQTFPHKYKYSQPSTSTCTRPSSELKWRKKNLLGKMIHC